MHTIAITTVMRLVPYLRHLFSILGLNVTPFTDAAIATAFLDVCQICPDAVDNSWPTDAQMQAVFDQLQGTAAP